MAPRFETGRPLLIAGFSQRYSAATRSSIPEQWQRFAPHIGRVPGQIGRTSYGVLSNTDTAGNTDYLCGVEVVDASRLPADFTTLRIPDHRYAVFPHRDHISRLRDTWTAIFQWLPGSGYQMAPAPSFELYDDRYDPATGTGLCEIWIPVIG